MILLACLGGFRAGDGRWCCGFLLLVWRGGLVDRVVSSCLARTMVRQWWSLVLWIGIFLGCRIT